jgi:hypothetical protein
MFSVITNIYNKKTKGPTLMELFTATGKLKKVFLQLEMLDVCTTGANDKHRYDIQVLATYASTRVHRYSSLPHDLADLKARIITAVKNFHAPMLTRVWQELEYRIDV